MAHQLDAVWKPHVVVAAVAERDGRFLIIEEEVRGQRVYNQPAGHLDPGESLVAAVIRECLEESAYHFTPSALIGVYQWVTPDNRQFLRFSFAGAVDPVPAKRALDHGIVAAHWFTHAEIEALGPKLRSPAVLRTIADYQAGVRFPLALLDSNLGFSEAI
jgi:8-oxo-dGTP pyrophosphatase MutT (NUDIX family)